jgi:hypothetical protein
MLIPNVLYICCCTLFLLVSTTGSVGSVCLLSAQCPVPRAQSPEPRALLFGASARWVPNTSVVDQGMSCRKGQGGLPGQDEELTHGDRAGTLAFGEAAWV